MNEKNCPIYLEKTLNKGIGCYASRDILQYEIISSFSGTLITYKEYTNKYNRIKKLMKHHKHHKNIYGDPSKYGIEINMSAKIDGILDPTNFNGILQENQSHAWHMNEPSPNESINCEIAKNYGTYEIVILAIKNITKEEELLTYYGAEYDRDYNICKLSYYDTHHMLYIYLGWIISQINNGKTKSKILGTIQPLCGYCKPVGAYPAFFKNKKKCIQHQILKELNPLQTVKILKFEVRRSKLEVQRLKKINKRNSEELQELRLINKRLKKNRGSLH